ncbi:hypothetical protein ACHAW5_010544 [Stephanodiscus triporus]|uniref:F-box/LRR-repeat protein 15-like leucin rich repeat domain-containing protein n=1 Tax=Stephanodiscus triporus TaxID=2934178 RepID=A0ABD3Q1B0_9STRA
MMGGSCSSHRQHRQVDHSDGNRLRSGSGRRCRSRSFSSVVGRLCGGSQDLSSEDESHLSARCSVKRAARHSIDAEVSSVVPNQAISNFYPPDDNYEPHPTDPTKRCPKSLTELCIDSICRSLPDLEGQLPAGLPQDVVDRIVQSLTSHAALNCTTLRALTNCELGALSLANCRGVSDEWLVTLSSSTLSSDSPRRNGSTSVGESNGTNQRHRTASNASEECPKRANFNHCTGGPPSPPPLRDVHPTQFAVPGSVSSMIMDVDDLDDLYSGDTSNHKDSTDDCCIKSCGSRSTSSFASASSRPTSPLLPSVLPPPEFFSLTRNPPAPSASLWLHAIKGFAAGDVSSNACIKTHSSPQKPYQLPDATDDSFCNDDASFTGSFRAPPVAACGTTSTLTLLDLRGSQRITDRGLLQLSHTPLLYLEVARLDNCHGITGRGLLAFSRSHRLHTLSMSNCRRLTDEAVVNVSHLGTSLSALNLGGCRCLTDRSLEALGRLVMLRKLDLSQCDLITDDGLVNLVDLGLIEELSLGWCRLISDDGLEIMVGHPNRSQALRTLRLARCSITDVGLSHLEKLENLEELDLNGCVNISSPALGDTLAKLTHLITLDVSYCPGILRSSWQGKINSLKTLELCYSGVKDSYLSHLRSLPMLEELNLDSCNVADWGIAHLVDNNVMPNLTTLDLADTNISDAAMSKISQFENMRHLSLFYCNISNRGLKHLSSMKKLEVLNLDSRDLSDDGLKYLSGLPLKSLDLFSSRVSDLGCVYLSKITSLTSLELCGGGIGDLGCAHLATLPNLASLNLSQNESITNCGAASLAALTNLKALNLSNTSVNSDALKFFGGLLKLQSLALYGCQDIKDSPKLSSLQKCGHKPQLEQKHGF